MKVPIRSLTALGVALAAILPGTASAQSYQVDCAILLCLAGVNGGDKTCHGAAQSQASCGVASGMARALAT